VVSMPDVAVHEASALSHLSRAGHAYEESQLHEKFQRNEAKFHFADTISGTLGHFLDSLRNAQSADVLPILGWLPRFIKQDIGKKMLSDAICGLTVAAIVLPQGMAYGMLAGLPPVNGLYTAMLPSLGYMIFGTSMHLSVGPFALIAMLSAEVIRDLVPSAEDDPVAVVEAAVVLSFFCGVTLVGLGILRLGFIASFLSDPVLSGYCTAVSIIIPTSQMKHAFQVKTERRGFIMTVVNLVKRIAEGDTNGYALLLFIMSMLCLLLLQELNKSNNSKLKILKRFPLPAELIVVILSTALVGIFNIDEKAKVRTLGEIPAGLPKMKLPDVAKFDIGKLASGVGMVSIMTYITAMSASKTFARKYGYDVDPSQELIALGCSNLLGSVSSCFPAAASLSRTAVVGASGAATPLHNAWTVVILVIVLCFCGPAIQTLPMATLAAIVVLAFRSMIQNGITEMLTIRKVSFSDFVLWNIAFWATLITDVTTGIAIAVTSDIFYLFWSTTRPEFANLGRLEGTSRLYRNRKHWKQAMPIPGIMIFRFDAALHFANREVFVTKLWEELLGQDAELNGEDVRTKMQFWTQVHEIQVAVQGVQAAVVHTMKSAHSNDAVVADQTFSAPVRRLVKAVVLDCSPMTHIDVTSIRALEKLRGELYLRGTRLVLAHVKYECHRKMSHLKIFAPFEKDTTYDVVCFRELHDAVLYAEEYVLGDQELGTTRPLRHTNSLMDTLNKKGLNVGTEELGHHGAIDIAAMSAVKAGRIDRAVGDDGELLKLWAMTRSHDCDGEIFI